MSLPFTTYTLNSLIPVEFTYAFKSGKEEELKKDYISKSNGGKFVFQTSIEAKAGQSIISYSNIEDPVGRINSIVEATGIPANTKIKTIKPDVEGSSQGKITLSANLTADIPANTDITVYPSQLKCFKHEVFENCQDVCVSKNTYLALTEQKALTSVFNTEDQYLGVQDMATSFRLRIKNPLNSTTVMLHESNLTNNIIAPFNPSLYKDHKLTPIIFTLIPVLDPTGKPNGKFEIAINNSKRMYINRKYPWEIDAVSENLITDEQQSRQFNVLYKKQGTSEGMVLSIDIGTSSDPNIKTVGVTPKDGILRGTGLGFNTGLVINPYQFIVDFLTAEQIKYDFNAKNAQEIKYLAKYPATVDKSSVSIGPVTTSNTHYLVSCPINSFTASTNQKVPINIAMLKTNFSTSGSYDTKQT